MRVILWTIAAIVASIANGKFLLWQNDPDFAYRDTKVGTKYVQRDKCLRIRFKFWLIYTTLPLGLCKYFS